MVGKLTLQKIGTVGGEHFTCNNVFMGMKELQDNYYNTFANVINQDV
jgi:phosphoribosylformylglycinamidine synthase